MKLTEMNIDCLEMCLEYLDFSDLINAADSNKHLNHATRYIFARKYSLLSIHMWKPLLNYPYFKKFSLKTHSIDIFDLRTGFQFLRCFGDLVYCISSSGCMNEHLLSYINEYCSESLTSFSIEQANSAWNNLKKPFNKVETVHVFAFGESVPTEKPLSQLFPKVRRLELAFVNHYSSERLYLLERDIIVNYDFLTSELPHLEHLRISIEKRMGRRICSPDLEHIAIALRSNHQLKRLEGNMDIILDAMIDTKNCRAAKKSLQNLEELSLIDHGDGVNVSHFTRHTDEDIQLKSLKRLNIPFNIDLVPLGVPLNVPFCCNQLESLELFIERTTNEQLYSLIEKYPTVRKLNLGFDVNHMAINLSQLANKLPLLEQLKVNLFLPIDEVVRVLDELSLLRVFRFRMEKSIFESGRDLLARYASVWSLMTSKTSFTFGNHQPIRFVVIELKKK